MFKKSLLVLAFCVLTQSAWAQETPGSKPSSKPSASKEVLKAPSAKARGLATFKEALVLVHHKKIKEVFGIIADGKGSKYSIPNAGFESDKFETPEKAAKFAKKNFPYYDELYRNFDKIKISGKAEKKKVKVYWDGVKKIATGTLHTYKMEIPGWTEKHPYFTRLQFLEVHGKIYFVPFGW